MVFLPHLKERSYFVCCSEVLVLEDLTVSPRINGPGSWIYIERVGRNYHKIVPDGHVVEILW